jgi:hypothetical protein
MEKRPDKKRRRNRNVSDGETPRREGRWWSDHHSAVYGSGGEQVFSLIETEDHQSLLRVLAPILQYAESDVYPVLDADEGIKILYDGLQ